MSWSSKAWIVATSVGAVEALKDQMGICRWNYVLRSVHQHAKNNISKSMSQPNKGFSSSSSVLVSKLQSRDRDEKLRQSEESLRNVMYLSCWGPN